MVLLVLAADADLILHNGKVVTVDSAFSVAQAVAVKSGRIVAVGTDRTVLQQKGANTQVMDLNGKTVLPGLIDAHVHPLEAGLSEFREKLPPLDSIAAVQSYIRDKAKTTPKGEWIVVPRTLPPRLKEMRFPTKHDLDVDTEHPVAFDGSYVWSANSLALKISGIARDTPNPPNGEIVKGPDGEPNGILRSASGLLKITRRAETFTADERLRALEQMLKLYAAAGLAAIGDRGGTKEIWGQYQKLKSQNRLPLRVIMTWRVSPNPPVEQVVNEIRQSPWTTNQGDEWLKLGSLKVTLDGGQSVGTAYQRAPYGAFGKQLYGQTNPDARGILFVEPDKLTAIFGAARDKGWALSSHVQGGGAIDTLLDVFERLDREKPIAPTRSHVIHGSFQSAESIARMKRMGVLADVQPGWLHLDVPALERVFGLKNMRYFYPVRTYIANGIVAAGGSDHMIGLDKDRAVNPFNPFLNMWMSITRLTTEGKTIYPEEKISREDALRMHTTWAAHLQFSEKERGTIETGKLADLVVIDRDFLKCAIDEIKSIQPTMTIVGGKTVYARQ
jgi:predicted amidohydrolase YtcJ